MKIYFSGIGGVGIGPLAQIAHNAGHEVVGSDQNASLLTAELDKLGVEYAIGTQDGYFLRHMNEGRTIDWFVYTAALPADHPELLAARQLGIKTAKRDELLSQIIQEADQKLIAIAGTHGKTGTTALAVWLFKELGLPVSYSIGSTVSFGASGQFDGDSQYFIYECDEFDLNFLHFEPYLSVVTSIDYDHPDTYPTRKEYNDAFKQFILQSELTVGWKEDFSGIDTANNVILLESDDTNPDISLPGEHIRKNATLLLKGLREIGVIDDMNYRQAIDIINNFPGADRRFERLTKNLYTDYAHHPKEIVATLKMVREVAPKNVTLIYQPHQNIRQHNILGQYKDQFINADKIYWLPTYLSRESPNLPILPPEKLTQNISNKDKIVYATLNDELRDSIKQDLQNGDLVIGMGAGDIDGWLRKNFSS